MLYYIQDKKQLKRKEIIEMKKTRIFATSGSCGDPTLLICGKVIDNITFISDEFSSTMDGQHFWDELAALAKKKNAYIELHY